MSRVRQLRQADIVIKPWVAAGDIVQATACVLAIHNREIGVAPYDAAWFAKVYNGAYYMVQRAIDSLPLSGKVPVAIFQLLAAIRSRPVVLDNNRGFTLNVTLSTSAQPGQLPPVDANSQRAGFSELIQCYAQIGGLTVDLERLENEGELVFEKIGNISYGKTLGPLNVANISSENKMYGILQVMQNYPTSEAWMQYLTWAESAPTGIFADVRICYPKFPVVDLGVSTTDIPYDLYYRPGIAVLTQAMLNSAIFNCSKVCFPAFLLEQMSAFISGDFKARGLTSTGGGCARAASLALARVAVESGQTSFIPALFEQTVAQLPEVLTEAAVIHSSYRNGIARIPIVCCGKQSSGKSVSYYTGTTVYQSDDYTEIVGYYGWLLTDYKSWKADKKISNNKDRNVAWGAAAPATSASVQINMSLFSTTISKGPLSQPGTDKSVGKLNMLDLIAEPHIYRTTGTGNNLAMGLSALSCFGSAEKDQDFRTFALFPLAYPFWVGALPDVPDQVLSDETVPAHRAITRVDNPVDAYTAAAVTEASAKSTALQQLMEDLNTRGLGANSIFSDIGGALGRFGKTVAKVAGVGHPVAGFAIDAVSDFVLAASGNRSKANVPRQRQAKKPAQGQGRQMAPQRRSARGGGGAKKGGANKAPSRRK